MENIPISSDYEKYKLLTSIIKYDLSEEINVPEKLMNEVLCHYKHINDSFKTYHKFDVHLFTKAFSYNMYLEATNFKTNNINYENIDINAITYYVIKYFKRSWDISDDDLYQIYCPSNYNKKTLLTRNYIYKYYTKNLQEAVKKIILLQDNIMIMLF